MMADQTEVMARVIFEHMHAIQMPGDPPFSDAEWGTLWNAEDEEEWPVIGIVKAQLAALDAAGYQIVPKQPSQEILA